LQRPDGQLRQGAKTTPHGAPAVEAIHRLSATGEVSEGHPKYQLNAWRVDSCSPVHRANAWDVGRIAKNATQKARLEELFAQLPEFTHSGHRVPTLVRGAPCPICRAWSSAVGANSPTVRAG